MRWREPRCGAAVSCGSRTPRRCLDNSSDPHYRCSSTSPRATPCVRRSDFTITCKWRTDPPWKPQNCWNSPLRKTCSRIPKAKPCWRGAAVHNRSCWVCSGATAPPHPRRPDPLPPPLNADLSPLTSHLSPLTSYLLPLTSPSSPPAPNTPTPPEMPRPRTASPRRASGRRRGRARRGCPRRAPSRRRRASRPTG